MTRWRRSAALRLALAYTACMALGIVVLWGLVFWSMHQTFRQQIDADLISDAGRLTRAYRAGGTPALEAAIAERMHLQADSDMLYALYDKSGQRLVGNLPHAMPPLGRYDLDFLDPVEGPDRARAYAATLSGHLRLVVAMDNERMERIDRTMASSFVAAMAGIALLGALGAVLFAGMLRERLGRIADQAHAIADGVVSARMPVSERGDEFDALAASLNHMLARIEALIVNLRQVSSALAHDLRTPLTRLHQRIETASTELAARDSAEACSLREQLDLASGEVEEVLGLFGAILHLSEVESGAALPMKTIDLSALVCEIGESYEPVFTETGRRLDWQVDAARTEITASRSLIAQALSNLVENALRHTPAGTTVGIRLNAAAGRFRLCVYDDGPGIAAQDRARALDRFVRLDAARATPGHGLGLPLVDAVARRHGGFLELVDAQPGLCAVMHLS